MKSFKGKVAAITGAASGMGRTLALELARRGCHLALSDVNETGLLETANMARPLGAKVTTTRLDVTSREAVFSWADQVVADHGKVNFIFNNAGVAIGAFVETISPEDFHWIMDINFWGVVWGTQAFLPHLKRTGDGHVINLSSLAGLMAAPSQAPYNASKFAVRGFTEALRQELDLEACGVSATCVHPGGIRTNIAHTARIDESVTSRCGGDVEEARARFNKALTGTSAESAALQILRAVERDERRALIGADAKFMDLMVRIAGSWYQPVTVFLARRMLAN
ncbi:SDR family oxidoreductase [Aquabacterium sp. CECT 9606]|uniref:SDR family NAD(P)-dependent oxidoreductase n=1 Tax=Aquabacterium sp. CECT 9606 TaxID=2845822 RepID=UPI001E5217E4|nr:SDR family oxidoreductase [Aquabacterium sp. CECT 9606]CAH0348305.1 Putative oxidoreductase SadH [Aquabacterium sp. CECT 9606]